MLYRATLWYKVATTMSKKSKNGKRNGHHNGHADAEQVMTVTFRISAALKKKVEAEAKTRGVTTTRVVVTALENEVSAKPPRWWNNRNAARVGEDAPS